MSIVTLPLAAGVHDHQTDRPPALPAWVGSPLSLVAPTLLPVRVPVAPLSTCAFAKASLAGAPEVVTVSVAAEVVALPALLVNTAR